MIIAQLSDLHIGFAGRGADCLNSKRLECVLKTINKMRKQPDMIIISGDLVDPGTEWAYRDLKRQLQAIDLPVFLALGNHDRRDAFFKVFNHYRPQDGFLQYTIEDWPMRIIVLDTLDENRHGGSFCKVRARWLDKALSEQPERPTLLVLHHPPVPSGINWLTARRDEPWVKRLEEVVSAHPNLKHLIAGHIHMGFFTGFAKTSLSVTPAIAPQLALELDDLDPDTPDNRPLLVEDRPGFTLHQWDSEQMTSHISYSPAGKILLRYTPDYQELVRHTLDIS